MFQGDPQTMRFVSSYSLTEAARGLPRLLEYQVIPGEDGNSVRLVVNEIVYTGPVKYARRVRRHRTESFDEHCGAGMASGCHRPAFIRTRRQAGTLQLHIQRGNRAESA